VVEVANASLGIIELKRLRVASHVGPPVHGTVAVRGIGREGATGRPALCGPH